MRGGAPRREHALSEGGRSQPGGADRDRGGLRRRPALGGPLALRGRGAAARGRHLEPRQPAPALPGAGSRPDLARPRRRGRGDAAHCARCCARRRRPGWSGRTTRSPGCATAASCGSPSARAGNTCTATGATAPWSRPSRPGSGKRAPCTAWTRPAAGCTSRARREVRSAATSTGSVSTAPRGSGCRARRAHMPRASIPPLALYLDTWSDVTTPPQVRLHRADGSEVRVVDRQPGSRPRGVPPVPAGAPARAHARWVPDGGDAPAPAGLRSRQALSGLPAHVRRAPLPGGQERVGRHHLPLPSAAGPARGRGLDVRQPHGQRQGRGFRLAHVPQLRRDWSCATSRTAWTGWAARAGWTPTASGSTDGAGGGYS